jgi:hypothetical protein
MTSKKRDDLPPVDDEEEPKRPRHEEAGKDDAEGKADGPPSPVAPGQGREKRRDWLSFSGRRQPRVGEDFQAVLPNISLAEEEGTIISTDGSKEHEDGA